MQTFSEQLIAARTAKGMTQEALAQAVSVTRSTISSWERGRFAVDENGVLPFKDDGRLRVVEAEARTLTLGELFDRAQNPAAEKSEAPTQLRLVAFGKTAAQGRLEQLASHPAFIVESLA